MERVTHDMYSSFPRQLDKIVSLLREIGDFGLAQEIQSELDYQMMRIIYRLTSTRKELDERKEEQG